MKNYLKQVGFAVTVSDKNGQVLAMNDKAYPQIQQTVSVELQNSADKIHKH